jgi:hypothetical protein
MKVTEQERDRFAAAFVLWDKEVKEDPDSFLHLPTDEYGQKCAAYFVWLLESVEE